MFFWWDLEKDRGSEGTVYEAGPTRITEHLRVQKSKRDMFMSKCINVSVVELL